MAMSFSPPNPVRTTYHQPKHGPNPPKAIISPRDTYSRGPNCAQCGSRFRRVVSCSSAANYVTLRAGTRRTAGKSLAVKRVSERRTGIIRCATIEEIEAQKSLIEKTVKEKMEKTIESVRSNFNSMRTSRANPSILDRVEVEYYGTPVNVKSIAQISTPDASSILVQPYDKSSLKAIEKAIVTSDLGLTPNNDGEVLRLSLPPLTSERRKELLKIVSKQAEEGKVALRNIRREAIKAYEKLEKEKKLSEDNVKDLSSDLQKVTDEYIKKVEAAYKQKEKEMLTV
ncbi:ribosome-recycling factor, chloroplastic-like [Actinidia eriantha]|uniref:ribosome-recycling factor, chloroplastic-like n=1 Tax=Actinidia eriantha TaxID=165200 RepID=UPI0025899F53|nr:ribosome-recycling factor, chloroplastic-like [Actinidia eriantha]